ncbi:MULTISPECIES: class I SAM-dependent methyltransferase [Streptomyces]|uniref:Class I SAM-dependent methyltransferase n=1 Tax=Streptomyces fuscus TaxID=3048495 RepID=A0ABT7IWJ3_9ACTN|nr:MULTISPECIES: class I SAM-dependent methyltransferase [Streptomyces]MCM1974643.1 class I SAM-dependent methyltransferase [Streptomyces sp. G1]MDL2076958.1 class I SAM-dependent methyltransferase [Streptomyces fuscus]
MSHTHALAEPRVSAALADLFDAAARDDETADLTGLRDLVDEAKVTAQELADAAQDIYMPVSREGAELLYSLVRATKPGTVVEFGTSYGISTLHLAAAVRDNDSGRVVTTEMNRAKAAAARRTFAATGLDDLITLWEGDALQTLAALDEPVGFLFLDGWKDLCLPVLRLLEPHLAPGTLVVADDIELPDLAPYLEYVRNPGNGYLSVSFPVADGMELSCRL